MRSVVAIPAEPMHVMCMKGRIRRADRHEVWAVSHVEAYDALMRSYAYSIRRWAFVSPVNQNVVAIGGVCPGPAGVGVPWLFGSDSVYLCKASIARETKSCVDVALEDFPILINYVHADNLTSKRWLQWCGFTLDEPEPYGVDGEMFHRFWQKGKKICAGA